VHKAPLSPDRVRVKHALALQRSDAAPAERGRAATTSSTAGPGAEVLTRFAFLAGFLAGQATERLLQPAPLPASC
jgi:hypothetical protein